MNELTHASIIFTEDAGRGYRTMKQKKIEKKLDWNKPDGRCVRLFKQSS
jgi:hypothetical protein